MPRKKSQLTSATFRRILLVFSAAFLISVFLTFFLRFTGFYDESSEAVVAVIEFALILSVLMFGAVWVFNRIDAKLNLTKNALQESFERLHQITENVPGAIYRYRMKADGSQSFSFVSKGIETLLGISREEVLKDFNSLWQLVFEEDMPGLVDSIRNSRKNLTPWTHDYRSRHKDGRIVWIRGRSIPEKPLADGTTDWNGILTDITEQKKLKDTVAASREHLERIVNTVADPIFVKDREHRWTLLNDACCALMGRRREALIGKSDYDFFPKEEADIFWAKDEEVFTVGIENLNEENFTDAAGRKHTIVTKKTRYVDPEGKAFIVGVIRDITESKKVMEDLEERNAELADFAHVVSHDLKAPTHAIRSLADWLWQDYSEQLPPKGREQIDLIRKKSQDMRVLIDGILQYSVLGSLTEKSALVDLQSLFSEVLNSLLIPSHIRVEISGTLPSVYCEKIRVRQIFQNLLTNAAACIDKQEGLIRISCKELEDSYEFELMDNGTGIDEKYKDKIFHLYQVFGGKPRSKDSTGIGLAIVRKAVEYHGGKIWFESSPGKGATFYFTLPKMKPGLKA